MAKRARNIFKRVRKYFFLSLGERINLPADWQAGVRAGQKATIIVKPLQEAGLRNVRPHPGPLLQGEGESSSVAW
jgi:hypothetical protein